MDQKERKYWSSLKRAKPNGLKNKESSVPKIHSQIWHAFRDAEHKIWNAYKEGHYRDPIMEGAVIDNSSFLHDSMEILVDKGGNLPPKPPDQISRISLQQGGPDEGSSFQRHSEAMHVDV